MNIINPGIEINVEKLLASRMLIQGASNSGKSHLIRRIAECITHTRVQQIIIDPEGEFETLRQKFDFVLVGKGTSADIPISVRYAETIAVKLLETGVSAIIDLSDMRNDEKIAFVHLFVQAINNASKSMYHPCIIYIDEAHKFCAEGNKNECASAVIDLCSLGRKRGYCAVLATQRLSKLHKDAAAELNNKMIGFSNLDNDIKRSGDELGFSGKIQNNQIKDLQTGEFFTYGPAISRLITKFKSTATETEHLSPGKRITTAIATPKAIQRILSKLNSIPQEAEQEINTRKQMQAEITRLQGEVLRLTGENTGAANQNMVPAEVENLREEINMLTGQIDVQNENYANIYQLMLKYRNIAIEQKNSFDKIDSVVNNARNTVIPEFEPSVKAKPVFKKLVKQSTDTPFTLHNSKKKTNNVSLVFPVNGTDLPIGELKILTACAQHPLGVTREQLTVFTGYKRSSRDAYLQRLRNKGYIEEQDKRILATGTGTDALGPDFSPLPTGRKLQEYWAGTLPAGELVIFKAVISMYPQFVTRDTISKETTYKRSSRDAYIQRLKVKELITVNSHGHIKASPHLF